MKVLHINDHLARKGGVETYLLALLPMLKARSIEAHVLYGEGDETLYESSSRISGINRAGFKSQAAARQQVADALARERPDIVHVHNVQNVGALQASLAYGPTVITAHDFRAICPANMFFYKRTQEVCGRDGAGPGCFATTLRKHCLTPRPSYAAYFYYRSTWSTRHADQLAHVIAPSNGAKQRLVRAGFEERLVTVLPYFCSLKPLANPRPLPSRPTITFMGRIAPNKGQEYFIEALGLLPQHVQGIMVGNLTDEARQSVRNLAREHGCENRLTLYPWASRAEVVSILDSTTVFIFPSLWEETLGIVGIEALSRGVPVVASDLGGVREWLQHGENGFLVQPKSAEQIRDAVLELIASDQKLLQFGRRGIETINEEFLPVHHVDQLVQVYERFAGRN